MIRIFQEITTYDVDKTKNFFFSMHFLMIETLKTFKLPANATLELQTILKYLKKKRSDYLKLLKKQKNLENFKLASLKLLQSPL